jgi:hypothetical protein
MYSRQKSNLICVRCGNECYEHSSSCTRCGALTQIDTSERTFSALPSKETDAKTGSARRGVADSGVHVRRNGRRAGLALCAVALFVAAAFYHDPLPTGLLEITICRSPLHAAQLSGVPFLKAAATQRCYKLSLDQWLPTTWGC